MPKEAQPVTLRSDSHDAWEGETLIYRYEQPWRKVLLTDPATGKLVMGSTRSVVETKLINSQPEIVSDFLDQ